jgi:hypothetical protein
MHEGYIIISEKLQGLAVYSQILRKQCDIFSRQFVTGMCSAMTGEKASFRSANQESAKIN